MSQPHGLQRATSSARFSPRLAPPGCERTASQREPLRGCFATWCTSVRCRFPRVEDSVSQPLLRHCGAEAEPVPVGIDERHLASVPLRVAERLRRPNATAANLAKQSIDPPLTLYLGIWFILNQTSRDAKNVTLNQPGRDGGRSERSNHPLLRAAGSFSDPAAHAVWVSPVRRRRRGPPPLHQTCPGARLLAARNPGAARLAGPTQRCLRCRRAENQTEDRRRPTEDP